MWNSPNGILRGLGETDSWKNLKSKISWHCHFKLPFACTKLYILKVADSRRHSLPTGNYIPWQWIYLRYPPPPPTNTQKEKQNCVSDVSIFKSGGGDFMHNAAKMFSFDPNPTRKKSLDLFYLFTLWGKCCRQATDDWMIRWKIFYFHLFCLILHVSGMILHNFNSRLQVDPSCSTLIIHISMTIIHVFMVILQGSRVIIHGCKSDPSHL